MNLKLIKLTKTYEKQLGEMIDEWKADQELNHTNHSPWAIFKNDYHDFDYYLENLERKEEADGKVPDSVFFLLDVERDRLLGAINIRHYLNEYLLREGGHIGDGIRPSERRKGYATEMIRLGLIECRKLGIEKVLMTCDKDNIGSAKSIINNGGVLENEFINSDGEIEQRYWITIDKAMKISDEQKIFELSKIWKEASYNFVYWDKVDIDWDEEYRKALAKVLKTQDLYDYYRELLHFAALLGDGHTAVTCPGEMMQDPEYFSMLPVYLWRFGKEIRVMGISEELEEKIPLGSLLVRIEGEDAADYVREHCYPYIWHANEDACGVAAMQELMLGRRGSSVNLVFEKDDRQFEIQLERTNPSEIVWSQKPYAAPKDYSLRMIGSSDVHKIVMTDDGIAVIKMTSFQDDSMPAKIYADYEELKKAKAYIIDVRGNGGGNSTNADAIAALFIDGDFKSCFGETQVYEPTYKAWSLFRDDFKSLSADEAERKFEDDKESLKAYKNGRNIFFLPDGGESVVNKAPGMLNGPVVVLMNENTVSAAEDFVDVMKQYTNAVFVGTNTAGTSGQPLFGHLESGGTYRICTRRCIAQNGEDIYNKGFSPDVRILQTAEDYAAGRDSAFEKAMEMLR